MKPLKKIPKTIDDHVIIISCEEDKAEVKNAVEMGFEIHSAEILLTGILRQEIDLTQYPFSPFTIGMCFQRLKAIYAAIRFHFI